MLYTLIVDGIPYTVGIEETGLDGSFHAQTETPVFQQAASQPPIPKTAGGIMPVKSPYAARVRSILRQVPAQMEEGQTVVALETDSGETEVSAPRSGRLNQVLVVPGTAVEQGDVLFVLK